MPAAKPLRILCIHGVGQHPVGGPWEREWSETVRTALTRAAPNVEPRFAFVHYDDLFEKHPITFLGTLEALAKLTTSAMSAPFRSRGLERGLGNSLRWTAGMVVKWVEDERFRRDTRERLAARLQRFSNDDASPPDLLLAHSLGSLVSYDTLTAVGGLKLANMRLVTFGSQIANPFVSGQFLAGRVQVPTAVGHWTHLYNPEDAAFAAPIRLSDTRFDQVFAPFDEPGVLDHSAPRYLGHPAAAANLWTDFGSLARAMGRGAGTSETTVRVTASGPRASRSKKPRRRALLVGINEYPNADDRLEGCVNDVFLMSSLLQESGYEADDIRVVLDGRATAAALRDRLDWLLDDVGDVDPKDPNPPERLFYFSGHGAQLPSYGQGDKVDRMDETLVPWDFDWTIERSLTDDAFHELYSQLPYGLRFLTIFDCCHSGGMTRDGGPRVRGLTPPDDIRHRALRWNAEVEMWQERELEATNEAFLDKHAERALDGARGREERVSRNARMTNRLGYSMCLRELDTARFNRRRKALGHSGPYMPLLMYACREEEVAMEYRHGAVSHGAFTYALVKNIRDRRKSGDKQPTFERLVRAVHGDLRRLGYEQHPVLAGPTVARNAVVPFATVKRTAKAARAR
ncbi:MAG: caspase family protein [Planctomycetota bacterium]|nr:MAG: caspase family protein [Planctomycetota bacterium]